MSLYIPVQLRQQVLELDAGCCAYCQSQSALMGVTFEIEHILPLSLGGENTLENLCLSCPSCNRYKSSKTTALDPESDAVVPLFHPRQEPWEKHFSWSHDAATVLGLTASGRATIALLRINRPLMIQLRRYWVVLQLHPPEINTSFI